MFFLLMDEGVWFINGYVVYGVFGFFCVVIMIGWVFVCFGVYFNIDV